jgi:hypothetical protein
MMKKHKYKLNIGNELADTLMALMVCITFSVIVKYTELKKEKDKNSEIKQRLERIEKSIKENNQKQHKI